MRRRALLIATGWSFVTLVAAAQTILLVRASGGSDFAGALVRRLAILPLWIAVTPVVLRSVRRFPVLGVDRCTAVRRLALHVTLGVVFVVAANLVIRVPEAWRGAGIGWLWRSTGLGLAEFLPAALVVYLALVAAGHLGAAAAPLARAEPECLTVHQWDRVHLVRLADIEWIEAEGNYVVVHAAGKRYRTRERISEVEARLDARRFVRIHRSTIVPVARVREVHPLTHGDHAVILRDGTILRVARARRNALQRALAVEL